MIQSYLSCSLQLVCTFKASAMASRYARYSKTVEKWMVRSLWLFKTSSMSGHMGLTFSRTLLWSWTD